MKTLKEFVEENGKIIVQKKVVKDELKEGIKVEHEHKPTYKKIREFYEKNQKWPDENMVYQWIAEDHLREHKDYYTILKSVEL